jgi:hypothetical protein
MKDMNLRDALDFDSLIQAPRYRFGFEHMRKK